MPPSTKPGGGRVGLIGYTFKKKLIRKLHEVVIMCFLYRFSEQIEIPATSSMSLFPKSEGSRIDRSFWK